MIRYIQGDLLESDAEALVNTVNCIGVMGKGIAKQFKKRFPDMFDIYKEICDAKQMKPGGVLTYWENDFTRSNFGIMIYNVATKNHWRDPSKYPWIAKGLETLHHSIIDTKVKSIAIPALGCGNGGLDWRAVKGMIEACFSFPDFNDVDIQVYEP